MKGFKEFIMRGNVIDLAVALVIGLAITEIIKAIVEQIIMPLIAAIFGQPNFKYVGDFILNGSEFYPGVVLTAIVMFVLTAAALYFLIVLPMNKLRDMRAKDETLPPTELELLTEIRDALVARNNGSAP